MIYTSPSREEYREILKDKLSERERKIEIETIALVNTSMIYKSSSQ